VHFVQLNTPAALKYPTAHGVQAALPTAPLNVPATQAVHPDALPVVAALPPYPAVQTLQLAVDADPVAPVV